MESAKLLTLAGLAASATTAAASPVYGLNSPTPDLALIPFNSTLFPGLKNDSPNLYPTFDLHCTKATFKDLETLDPLKKPATETEDTSKFQLSYPTGTVIGDGCLKIDFKYFKDSKTDRGNLVATIEMAAAFGSYGIILMNSISNMLNKGGSGFDYRVIFLHKENTKWEIKAGVQWQDKLFMDGSKPERMKWHLPQNETIDEIFWKSSICRLSKDCEAQLRTGKTKVEKKQVYKWCSPKSTNKNIYQGLKMENLNPSGGSISTDLWNGEETPMSGSNVVQKPSAIFVNGQWQKTTSNLGVQMNELQNWFNKFKGDKGYWE